MGGDWRMADYALLAADAAASLEWLAGHPAVVGSRVGILGLSEGGAIALTVAALQPERVAFLILASPPGLPGERALEDQLERTMRESGLGGPPRWSSAETWTASSLRNCITRLWPMA
jgi:uncharacterized protein